jgi:hypothetical protein
MQYYQTTEEKEPDQPAPLSVVNQQQLRSVIFEGLLLANLSLTSFNFL